MTDAIAGGCLCGRVRFRITPPTDFLSHCHCRSCRLSHGAAFVTWTSVPLDRFAYEAGEAELTWYRSSPHIAWAFCGTCGSPLLYQAVAPGHHESPKTDRIYVSAACLEGPLNREPQAHVSYEERVPWHTPGDGLPRYRGKGDTRIE